MLKALKYTIDHPEEAAEIMNKAQPAADKARRDERDQADDAVRDGGRRRRVRRPRRGARSRAIAILQGAGLIPPGLTADQVVDFDLTPKA